MAADTNAGAVEFRPEGAQIEVRHLGDAETRAEPPPGLIPTSSPTPTP